MDSVVDLHVDTLSRASRGDGCFSTGEGDLAVDYQRCQLGSVRLLLTALYTTDGAGDPWGAVNKMLAIRDQEPRLKMVTTPGQVEALDEDEVGSLVTIENGQSLQGRRDRVEELHRRGVRIIGVTWNGANDLGEGVMEDHGNGLTPAGLEIIEEVKKQNMAIDISHLNPAGVDDVASSGVPFLATHSNARSIWDHPRNLTDDQIRCIGDRGGIIGLNIFPPFLGEADSVDISTVVEHYLHVADLIGPWHLALGTDLDGISKFPDGLEDHSDIPHLAAALKKAGFSGPEVSGILGHNFLRWWGTWSCD